MSKTTKVSPFVFISYSRQDQKYAEQLAAAFKTQGLSVWIDNSIPPGTRSWSKEIWKNLKACHAFVVIMTPRSLDSHWVDCELIIALERKKKIFPILLEDERWFNVANIQHIDVRDGSLPPDSFFREVSSHFSSLSLQVNDDSSQEDSEDSEENEFEALVEARDSDENATWLGDWFVNVGEGVHRTWDDCVKYGLISAGQGAAYIKGLKRLEVGSIIYAYMAGHGYVGVGTVTSKAVPIREFTVGSNNTLLLEMPLQADRPEENKDNLELSEWVVGVRWLQTVDKEKAYRFIGAFANPQVVCKLRHRRTLEFLHEKFNEWNREWFINAGEGKGQRSWEDCRKHGFISAGQGPKFAKMMKKLEVGDTVYAYVTSFGYVGFGKVIEKAVPIREFAVDSNRTTLLEMDLEANGLARNKDDDESCEWVARIDWCKTFPKDQAFWYKGAFHHLGTACKLKNQETLTRLYEVFDVPISA